MKRFYREVATEPAGRVFTVTLDGKSVRTPGRFPLEMPTVHLANAIAEEWRSQGDEIHPRDMPLTQLANSAIDRTRPQRTAVIEQVAAYAETDLLCYRVSEPPDLAQIQADSWQPLLDWVEATYGARLSVTAELAPLRQPETALLAIYRAVAALDDFMLTGLHAATAVSGSVVIGLTLVCSHIDAERGYELSQLDELYQARKWGDDDDARSRREEIFGVLAAADRFMALCGTDP